MAQQANLLFTHPEMEKPLKVWVNPNQIEWSYGLNVANYPTYGGEVIQILSSYIDDMQLSGNVSTYHQMEWIHRWFIIYIQKATTGHAGSGKFNVQPVSMFYKERGWRFLIYPKGMPNFRYGTEVVSPEWTMQAAVVDPDQEHPLKQEILTKARTAEIASDDGFPLFGKATGNIGFEEEDPFSGPVLDPKIKKEKEKALLHGDAVRGGFKTIADRYNKLLPAYLEGNFEDLTADFSKPITYPTNKPDKPEHKGKAGNGGTMAPPNKHK